MLDLQALRARTGCKARNLRGHRAWSDAGRGHTDCTEDSDRFVHTMRDEGSRMNGACVPRGRNETHLGHGLPGDVTQIHPRTDGEADVARKTVPKMCLVSPARHEIGRAHV